MHSRTGGGTSSRMEDDYTDATPDVPGPARGVRIWDAPRGPPPPIPVNEPPARALSFPVADALIREGHDVQVALTDIDADALRSGFLGIHLQSLPTRGTAHPWALWCGSDDGPIEEARARTAGRPAVEDDEDPIADFDFDGADNMADPDWLGHGHSDGPATASSSGGGLLPDNSTTLTSPAATTLATPSAKAKPKARPSRKWVQYLRVLQNVAGAWQPRKRAYARAIHRAELNPLHSTWYRGGLNDTLYYEVLTWLQAEAEANRGVDICFLQETAWPADLEYTTKFTNRGLVNADQIRTAALIPGRALHLRLLLATPLDCLCLYQHAWNLQKASLKGNKQEALLKLRRRIWELLDVYRAKNLTQIKDRLGTQIDFVISRGNLVRANLHNKAFAQCLRTHVVPGLQTLAETASVDAQLLAGWKATTSAMAQEGSVRSTSLVEDFEGQRLGQDMGLWRREGTPFRLYFQAWRLSSRIQQQARQLRKACRSRKTAKIAAVVQDANIHQAAKQFAPKVPRRRLGDFNYADLMAASKPMKRSSSKLWIISNFSTWDPDLAITTAEIQQALQRLRPGKVLPSSSAPAALWKFFAPEVVEVLHRQFQAHLSAGTTSLPLEWNLSELVLLPKAGKTLRSPAHLRPICLLPLQAKVLAAVLAGRLQPFAVDYLHEVPQFAYVPHRTLQQALDRVLSHCAAVRTLSTQNQNDPHARRQGKTGLQVCGGLQLSLDITGAYDYVPRQDLEAALRAAAVPDSLIQAVLLIHAEARLQIQHGSQQLHDPEMLDIARAGTVYADDKHFAWLLRTGRDVEKAYAAVRYVLTSLHRYVVRLKDGPHLKFSIDGSPVYIKVVQKHVLGIVLRNRSIPQRLRLQLWQGCIWPALLHGLECTGLPLAEMQALQTQLIVQARSLVRSYSMFTRETNVDFVKRLQLPSPVQRLQRAFTRRLELDAHLGPSLQLTDEQQQWRHLVRGQLFATMANLWQPQCLVPSQEAKARVVCVEKVLHETFECEICGQYFMSQASLGHHQYSKHFADQQEARDVERAQARKTSPMEHALDRPEVTVLPLLNESLVNSETLLSLAKDSDWKVLAQAEIEITRNKIGIQNPCQYCGQSYTRKEGEGPLPMELQDLREATKELHMIQGMVRGLEDPFALSDQLEDDRPQKWQRQNRLEPQSEGKGGKGGKGQKGGSRSYRSWPNKQGQRPQKGGPSTQNPQGQQDSQIGDRRLEELQAVVNLLTTIVLRQEVQLNIFHQDTAYVMFLQAQGPGNLAQSLYAVGSGWHRTKEQSPEQLTSPMRVVLFQHVLERVAKGFEEMMASPSSRSKAIEMEWLTKDESLVQAMRWSPTENRHVVADAQTPSTIRQALQELFILSSQDFVVTRFHGMRKLAEEYEAPILGMFLEVGNRVEAAQKAWRSLHQLSALSKRLAALTRASDSLVHLWMHPVWLSVVKGWRYPSRQHDVAEFLTFLCEGSLLEVDRISLLWQSRGLDEGVPRTFDAGGSAPLLLPPPGNLEDDCNCLTSVGFLLRKWHEQEEKHAALVPTPIVILQISRFHYATDRPRASKRRYEVDPDPFIGIPVFTDGLHCQSAEYRLNSVIVHLGEVPDMGHYQTLLYCAMSSSFMLADDGVPAVRISRQRVNSLRRDVYLFVYERVV
ncbi:Crnkl1 [Symbiodinium sp. CCMP2592]|nr:Crnkl1 [Symbiodinium sp. CCMP2592]